MVGPCYINMSGMEDDARRLANQLWGIAPWSRHSPVPTPVSMSREDVPMVLRGYLVAAKTDGERCTLVLGAPEGPGAAPGYAFRFDRAGRATRVRAWGARPVRIPGVAEAADLFEGTLLDCEYMADRGELVVLDCVALCGYDAKGLASFPRRLALAALVPTHVALAEASGRRLRLVRKPFRPVDQIGSIDPTDRADGVIFMPRDLGVQRGRCASILKFKPDHTVDLLFRGGSFLVGDDDRLLPCEDVGLTVDPGVALQEDVVYEVTAASRGPIEDGELRTFRVVAARPDKGVSPNQRDTVEAALRHIDEGLTFRELCAMVS